MPRTRSSSTRSTPRKRKSAQPAAAPNRWRVLRQLGLLVGILSCGFAGVALATYDAADPAFSRAGVGEVTNAGGPVGALVADVMVQLLGYGAGVLPLLGVVLAIKLAGRPLGGPVRALAGAALSWVLLCVLAILVPADPQDAFPAGGLIGTSSAGTLVELVGDAGVWIVLLGVAMIALTYLARLDWEAVAGRAVSGAETAVPQVGRIGARFGRRAVGSVAQAGARVAEQLRRDDFDDEDEYLDTGSIQTTDPDVFEESAARAPAVEDQLGGVPMGAIDFRPEPALGPLPMAASRSVDHAVATAHADAAHHRTQAGSRELVEVEWVPTAHPGSRVPNPPARPTVADAAHDEVYVELPDIDEPVLARPTAAVLQPVSRAGAPEPAPAEPAAPATAQPPGPPNGDRFDDASPSEQPSEANDPTPSPMPAADREQRRGAPVPVRRESRGAIQVDPDALVSGGADDGRALIASGSDAAFELPHLGLLDEHERNIARVDEIALRALADTLEKKLADFKVDGEVTAIRPGPVITTFEYQPAAGIKLSKISSLEDDIAMALKALRVRIVAPIPGKGVVGFEVPNKRRQTVWIRDLLGSEAFRKDTAALPMVLGKSVEGKPHLANLAKAPHLLVAGTTGSGKSVGVNAMLLSMLFTRTPEEMKLLLIDPKMLEFELYRDIPHLIHPVVTDPGLANAALKWACQEMDDRYRILARWKTRNIASYNKKVEQELKDWTPAKAWKFAPRSWPKDEPPPPPRKLPYLVIVIDELADLMMIAAKEVETSIARIAQKARAAGIHLIVATQRPEKTVVTGIIKANMPSRIAFQVRSRLDGRIILDQNGAESLLGKGDMLFLPPGVAELVRCHGAFVSDDEVRNVCDFLRAQGEPDYEAEIRVEESDDNEMAPEDYDEYYDQAVAYVVQEGKASTSMIQREFKIGYNRAARMVEVMEREGVVGPADGARPRKVLVMSGGGVMG